ncbi:MAG: NAD(P)H-dependent oxidoreductase subunit E, partial [Ethanoligenens sp.]
LTRVAELTGISEGEIFRVATFYQNFSLTAKGRYVIKVCDGTACHVRKSIPILNALREHLGVSAEKPTTEDNLFTVETVSCLGACGLAPVMTVNDHVHPKMTPESALEVVSGLRGEAKE